LNGIGETDLLTGVIGLFIGIGEGSPEFVLIEFIELIGDLTSFILPLLIGTINEFALAFNKGLL